MILKKGSSRKIMFKHHPKFAKHLIASPTCSRSIMFKVTEMVSAGNCSAARKNFISIRWKPHVTRCSRNFNRTNGCLTKSVNTLQLFFKIRCKQIYSSWLVSVINKWKNVGFGQKHFMKYFHPNINCFVFPSGEN